MTEETKKWGMTNWNEEVSKPSNYKLDALLNLKLNQGNNFVRFVTRPYKYVVHEYKEEGDTGMGDRILCSHPDKKVEGSCPLCDQGFVSKERYKVGVIDRVTSTYKIIDISKQTYGDIKEYVLNPKYGSPERYDINLKVDKLAPPAKYYTIMPDPPDPLSVSDLELQKKVDFADLDRKTAPLTAKQVEERIVQVKKWRANKQAKAAEQNGGTPAVKQAESKPKAQVQSMPVVADDAPDFTFPQVS